MFKKALVLSALVGCIKHPVEYPAGIAGMHQFAGANFSSTNSPCMDGVIVALDHACNIPMEMEQNSEYIMLQCQQVRKGAPPWDQYNIVAIIDPTLPDPPAMTIMCMDPYARVFLQQRP